MTTRVIVSCPENNHMRLAVQTGYVDDAGHAQINPKSQVIVDKGKSHEAWVYGGHVLIVKEIP